MKIASNTHERITYQFDQNIFSHILSFGCGTILIVFVTKLKCVVKINKQQVKLVVIISVTL